MRLHRFFMIFAISLLFLPGLGARELLTQADISEVMNQLFEYHIDKKEMSPAIMERAWTVYIQQFDPSKAYLLQKEVTIYLHPNKEKVQTAMREYASNNMQSFVSLNKLIQESILRARELRHNWEKNPALLLAEAKEYKPKLGNKKKYPSDLKELSVRQKERLLLLISLHLDEIKGVSAGQEDKLVALCEKQLSLMENEYLGLDDLNRPLSEKELEHQLVQRTLKAYAASLDAHTAYYSPDEAYAMKVQLEKGMCGIGVVLREGIDGVTIHEILKGGPADKCGNLKIGDTIVEVDGTSVKGISFHHVLEVMRGKEGSKTVLGIIRPSKEKEQYLQVELVRSKITLEDKRVDIQSEPYGDGIIGKITLYSFYEGDDGVSSETDLKKAIDSLKSQGKLYGLILDMRENSGGFLSQAIKVSGIFISSGVVAISKYSDGQIKYYRTVGGKRYYDGPLVMLISRGSASATEIVAGALRDYGVALVVGDEQTYGKGTIQHQTVTNHRKSSFFKVTVGRYYTVSGKSPQIGGVRSDIVVPTLYNYEEIGEAYLDFPLPEDHVDPAFNDTLSDMDPLARKWFSKYYLPHLQKHEENWEQLIPTLQANSRERQVQNKNYQLFLKKIKKEIDLEKESRFGSNDLQMEESVNIVKDMIFLSELRQTAQ